MSLRSPIAYSKIPPIVFCLLLLWTISLRSMGQERKRNSNTVVSPRVGTIKDYPATGLMTGCGNLYAYLAHRSSSAPEAYIFLSRGDGSNAWMNLDGRDVRLQQLKPIKKGVTPQQYYYRLGTLRITVGIEAVKPKDSSLGESDPMFKMKITLRRGTTKRIVRAVGDSDC